MDIVPTAENIIATGTRDRRQTAANSINPIDIVTQSDVKATGQADLRDALSQLLPSLTRQNQGGGQAGAIDSISLRGLSPNHTLILVNGKRRHTTSNIYNDTGIQQGATPTDIDLIPAGAIDHIEVLRDGASAQYGSDAVAGVVNIILKKNTSGSNIQDITGQTYAGDGFKEGVNLNQGLQLGRRGYANLSADFVHQDHTVRSATDIRTGAITNPTQSDPEYTRETFSANLGTEITENINFYSLLTYAHRHSEAYLNNRPSSALTSYVSTVNIPTLSQAYSQGFTPTTTTEENDFSIMAGFKGTFSGGWNWDLSSTYGADYINLGLKGAVNPVLYDLNGYTTSQVHLTSYASSQWTTNFDVTRAFKVNGLSGPLNLALGAEHRYETYHIGAGDYGSYAYGGTLGQAGIFPANRSDSSRDVYGVYGDLSANITRKWQVDLAGRFEHYTDVGNTYTGKIGTRYDFTHWLAARAAISNGFTAPSLAQEHYGNYEASVSTASGVLPASSAAAQKLGASPLKPERSTSLSGGFVLHPISNLTATVDAYQIDIRDRIVEGGTHNGTAAVDALAAYGVVIPSYIPASAVQLNYFTNAASTRTQGVDFTTNYHLFLGNYGNLNLDAAANINRTRLSHMGTTAAGAALLTPQQVAALTTMTPHSRLSFGGVWLIGKWDVALHELRYGHSTSLLTIYSGANANSLTHFNAFENNPKWVTNFEFGYAPTHNWHVALGANNLFNVHPSTIPYAWRETTKSQQYVYNVTQISYDGGFYYFRVNASF